MKRAIWPRSLMGQMLLAVAVALLLVQGFGAMLVYRAQSERREAALLHAAAFRVLMATRDYRTTPAQPPHPRPRRHGRLRLEHSATTPLRAGEAHDADAERELRRILSDQDMTPRQIVVIRRSVSDDPRAQRRAARELAVEGKRIGLIDLRAAGEVVDISFERLERVG